MTHHPRHFPLVLGLIAALAITQLPAAQVFPISVDSVIESGCEAAFDGSNYLVGVRGGPLAEGPITAQLVSPTGTVVRSGISPGESGGMPRLAFDGTNYLMVWAGADATPGFRGQFVSKSGDLVRPVLKIGSGRPTTGTTATSVAYGGGRYLACWSDNTNLRGQLVNPDGTFFGPSLIVSGSVQEPRENAIAFDGTNFLVVFNGGAGNLPSIYGRFVSPQGGLSGGPEPVLLDSSPDPSDNPLAVCFDGTGYLVVFNDEVGADDSRAWHIFGRLVSTSGVVSSTRLALTANTGAQRFPFLACDGSNYLMAWGDGADPTGANVVLRFFDRVGQPVGPEFLPFTPQGAKRPMFGAPLFDGTRYLVTAVLVGLTSDQDIASADVYGTFVSSILPPPLPFNYTTNNGAIAITGYTGPGGVVAIPAVINGLPVTTIEQQAFSDCAGLTSVTIPSGVTRIGYLAFYGCTNLINVTIHDSITSIEAYAFAHCTGLTGIALPDSVTRIGWGAFSGCSRLTSATLGSSVISIEGSDKIPNHGIFSGCMSLTNITIPDSVTDIGGHAFYGCTGLTSIAIPNSVISIGWYAFSDCSSLTSATLGRSVISIGWGAFSGCSRLTSVVIPNSVTYLGNGAFNGCTGLTRITIPNSVTSIGYLAFANCGGLKGVYFQGSAPDDRGAFGEVTATVYYLPGTTGWDTTFGDRPTALWVLPAPVILTAGSNLGVQANRFGFTISWATNTPVVVEAATDLANPTWSPVSTNTLINGSSYFTDPQWSNSPARFYRLRSP